MLAPLGHRSNIGPTSNMTLKVNRAARKEIQNQVAKRPKLKATSATIRHIAKLCQEAKQRCQDEGINIAAPLNVTTVRFGRGLSALDRENLMRVKMRKSRVDD